MYHKLAKLIKEIANAKTCEDGTKLYCNKCINALCEQLKTPLNKGEPIHFILPAFPAKSANRDKVLSPFPDMGEVLALFRLQELINKINHQYPDGGAGLTICSDGYVFNDIVGVHDKDVWGYKKQLMRLCAEHKLTDINFFDLYDAYGVIPLETLRKKLIDDYADSIETIKKQVKNSVGEGKLFNGLHRFLYEDIKYLHKNLSKNQIRKIASLRTYQTIQRSHAWSTLVNDFFPNAIRLSIHPHPCTSGKLSFQLVPSENKWATPWHNVVVKTKNRFELMKKSQAVYLDAKLVSSVPMMHHFVME